jgi:hypothetical protein
MRGFVVSRERTLCIGEKTLAASDGKLIKRAKLRLSALPQVAILNRNDFVIRYRHR